MNKPTKMIASALAGGAVLLTAACGSSSDRPSVSDIQKALTNSTDGTLPSGVSSKVAQCAAQAIHDSKLSDSALKALVNHDKTFKPTASDETIKNSLTPELEKCLTN